MESLIAKLFVKYSNIGMMQLSPNLFCKLRVNLIRYLFVRFYIELKTKGCIPYRGIPRVSLEKFPKEFLERSLEELQEDFMTEFPEESLDILGKSSGINPK